MRKYDASSDVHGWRRAADLEGKAAVEEELLRLVLEPRLQHRAVPLEGRRVKPRPRLQRDLALDWR